MADTASVAAGRGLWELPRDRLIRQGAEARIYDVTFVGQPALVKERFSKKYRHASLDQSITQRRTAAEARALVRCRQIGVDVPTLLFVDLAQSRIYMERLEGVTVRDHLRSLDLQSQTEQVRGLADAIGLAIARLHSAGIIHGDLTTSNLMLRAGSGALAVIDFGLTAQSLLEEDRAVDLYVLERALLSTHAHSAAFFALVLRSYGSFSDSMRSTLARLDDVRARGRKRSMVG